jgi:hypothetical protein
MDDAMANFVQLHQIAQWKCCTRAYTSKENIGTGVSTVYGTAQDCGTDN